MCGWGEGKYICIKLELTVGSLICSRPNLMQVCVMVSLYRTDRQTGRCKYLSLGEVEVHSDFVSPQPGQVVVVGELGLQLANLLLGECRPLLPGFTAHIWLVVPVLRLWNKTPTHTSPAGSVRADLYAIETLNKKKKVGLKVWPVWGQVGISRR